MGEKWKRLFGSEWNYIVQLGSAIHDPDSKKEFWENIKARKLADKKFSIYELFPKHESPREKAMRECMEAVRARRRMPKGESNVG